MVPLVVVALSLLLLMTGDAPSRLSRGELGERSLASSLVQREYCVRCWMLLMFVLGLCRRHVLAFPEHDLVEINGAAATAGSVETEAPSS